MFWFLYTPFEYLSFLQYLFHDFSDVSRGLPALVCLGGHLVGTESLHSACTSGKVLEHSPVDSHSLVLEVGIMESIA